jgi:ABC-type phosphate transport system permease subunit
MRFITIIIATVLPLMATACGGTAPSPGSKDWHRQAWAGALVLIAMVSLSSLLARYASVRVSRLRASDD